MEPTETSLVPAIARPPRAAWYPICLSTQLRASPLARRLFGIPLVVFRDAQGRAAVLSDRCPHRSVPLSTGKVQGGDLECPYHGWRFAGDGHCTHIPGYVGDPGKQARAADPWTAVESQGFVWVWGAPDQPKEGAPFQFHHADDPAYLTVRREQIGRSNVLMMVENALDVPHTAFLHGGLFRQNSNRRRIQARVRRFADSVEAEFLGEQSPRGLAGRLLSPSGGAITHFDRFFLPSIIQVEYRLGEENHLLLQGACTPNDDWTTTMFACITIRTRLPAVLIQPFVEPVARWIFSQDQWILNQQTDTIHTFKDTKWSSTDLDLLGPHIVRLMRRAEAGQVASTDAEPYERLVDMEV